MILILSIIKQNGSQPDECWRWVSGGCIYPLLSLIFIKKMVRIQDSLTLLRCCHQLRSTIRQLGKCSCLLWNCGQMTLPECRSFQWIEEFYRRTPRLAMKNSQWHHCGTRSTNLSSFWYFESRGHYISLSSLPDEKLLNRTKGVRFWNVCPLRGQRVPHGLVKQWRNRH